MNDFFFIHYLFAEVEEKVFLIIMGNTGTCSFLFCWSSFVFVSFFFLRVSLRSFFPGPGARGYFLAIYFFPFFPFSYFLRFGFL